MAGALTALSPRTHQGQFGVGQVLPRAPLDQLGLVSRPIRGSKYAANGAKQGSSSSASTRASSPGSSSTSSGSNDS